MPTATPLPYERRRVDVAVQPLALPQFLAGLRVEALQVAGLRLGLALHVAGLAEDQLVLAVDLGDERRAPRAVRLVVLPDRLAGLLVDREEEVAALAFSFGPHQRMTRSPYSTGDAPLPNVCSHLPRSVRFHSSLPAKS